MYCVGGINKTLVRIISCIAMNFTAAENDEIIGSEWRKSAEKKEENESKKKTK